MFLVRRGKHEWYQDEVKFCTGRSPSGKLRRPVTYMSYRTFLNVTGIELDPGEEVTINVEAIV